MNVDGISKTHTVNMIVCALYGGCFATCNWWQGINPRKVESFLEPQHYIPLEHLRH